jgi:hypothetical protein
MNDLNALNQRFEALAWGAIFILLGGLMFVPGDQNNLFVLGIGVILIGLNLARRLNQIAVNRITAIIGGFALGLGGLSLLWPLMGTSTPFEVDIFPLIVLSIGLYLVLPEPKRDISG